MFRSSNSVHPQNTAANGMTGLERAKLERTFSPTPSVEELPPQPTAVAAKPVVLPKPVDKPAATANGSTAHLLVGPGVTLKGEILGCDTLRVEGNVEGNATARQLIICASGGVHGTVEIEEGDIEGRFEGTLNVAGRLFLRATGHVNGTLSYGQIEVERGGEILGDIAVRASRGGPAASLPRIQPAPTPAKPAPVDAAKRPPLLARA